MATANGGTEAPPTADGGADAPPADAPGPNPPGSSSPQKAPGPAPAAGDDTDDEAAAEAQAPQVPDELSLLYFLGRKELADCAVRLSSAAGEVPGSAASAGDDNSGELAEGQVVRCHKLALCSASGYFFKHFLGEGVAAARNAGAEAFPTVELPPLPQDEEIRRQVHPPTLFPLVLSFIYGGQRWETIEADVNEDNAMGLFAMGELLQIKPLARKAFEYIEGTVLSPTTAAKLLYAAVQLQGSGAASSFEVSASKCSDVLRQSFDQISARPEDLELLCQLPIGVLGPILEADDLEVPSEASVLEVARRVLRGRMKREEVQLTISSVKLTISSPKRVPQLKAATGGVVWEALVLEEPSQTALLEARAEAPKYASVTEALSPPEPGAGECDIGTTLTLKIPTGSVGPGKSGGVALRVRAVSGDKGGAGEVILAGALPTTCLPAPVAGANEGTEAEAELCTPAGKRGAVIRFRWSTSPVSDQSGQATGAESGKADGGEAGGEAQATTAAAGAQATTAAAAQTSTITEDETTRILGSVRFPHLEHKELLAAVKDPVLVEAGAQQCILEALSSRLDVYEKAGDDDSAVPRQQPRPSTIRRTVGPSKAAARPPKAETPSPRLPPEPPSYLQSPPGSRRPPTSPADAGGAAGSGSAAARRMTGGGAAGHPLFPCTVCGMGSVCLKQRDLRWCIECSQHPACHQAINLPSCITAAAVDGHCAACTLRLNRDVRTLTVRVGHQHAATLQRLPGGVDTLRVRRWLRQHARLAR